MHKHFGVQYAFYAIYLLVQVSSIFFCSLIYLPPYYYKKNAKYVWNSFNRRIINRIFRTKVIKTFIHLFISSKIIYFIKVKLFYIVSCKMSFLDYIKYIPLNHLLDFQRCNHEQYLKIIYVIANKLVYFKSFIIVYQLL